MKLLKLVILISVGVFVVVPAYLNRAPFYVWGGHEPRLSHYAELQAKAPAMDFVMQHNSTEDVESLRSDYRDGKTGFWQRISVWRFPDTRSCLDPSESAKQEPNLLKFDWSSIWLPADLEVCVFRIASSLGSVAAARAWFQHQGYEVSDPYPSSIPRSNATVISAGRRFSYDVPPTWPSWGLYRWYIWSSTHAETVLVHFDPEERALSVSQGYTVL